MSITIREARSNEITFLVSAFESTLQELKGPEINVVVSKRTSTNTFILLKQSQEAGVPSFIAVDDGNIIGCLALISDGLMFDVRTKSAHILTLYVEPQYRHKNNIAKQLIMYADNVLRLLDVKSVTGSLLGVKFSQRFLSQWNVKKIVNIFIDLSQ